MGGSISLLQHQRGNNEVPGSMPGLGLSSIVVSLGKKLHSHSHLLNQDIMCIVYTQDAAEEQPLADTVIPGKITCQKGHAQRCRKCVMLSM